MVFIEENNFNHQISLLAFIATTDDYNICAWLYPESLATNIAGFVVSDNPSNLIPVTTYENGYKPKCTKLVPASKSSFRLLSDAETEIRKNCDSLALFKSNQKNWVVSSVGHEGMCLIQDDSLLNSLIQAGFNASLEAPSWW